MIRHLIMWHVPYLYVAIYIHAYKFATTLTLDEIAHGSSQNQFIVSA